MSEAPSCMYPFLENVWPFVKQLSSKTFLVIKYEFRYRRNRTEMKKNKNSSQKRSQRIQEHLREFNIVLKNLGNTRIYEKKDKIALSILTTNNQARFVIKVSLNNLPKFSVLCQLTETQLGSRQAIQIFTSKIYCHQTFTERTVLWNLYFV